MLFLAYALSSVHFTNIGTTKIGILTDFAPLTSVHPAIAINYAFVG